MRIDLKDPENWIPKDIFQAYCGEQSEKLLAFYDKAFQKKNMLPASLNWLAILILPAWLGYRRQWNLLIAVTVIIAALPFIEAIFSITLPNNATAGGFLAAAIMANGLLLTNAQNSFTKLRQGGMDMETIKTRLTDKAAPSVLCAVLGLASSFGLVICAGFLADVIFGLPY